MAALYMVTVEIYIDDYITGDVFSGKSVSQLHHFSNFFHAFHWSPVAHKSERAQLEFHKTGDLK